MLLKVNVVLWVMASSLAPSLLKLKLVYGLHKTFRVLSPGVAVSYTYMLIDHVLITSQNAAFVLGGFLSLSCSPNPLVLGSLYAIWRCKLSVNQRQV